MIYASCHASDIVSVGTNFNVFKYDAVKTEISLFIFFQIIFSANLIKTYFQNRLLSFTGAEKNALFG